MKKSILSLLMSALMLTWVSCGDGRKDSAEMAEDQNEETVGNAQEDAAEFAVEAADLGLLEVQLSTMALTKASSAQVKQFAQMMVDDHTKTNNELKALAQEKNYTLPSTLGTENQRKYDNFNEKTGADFDKEYMDRMVKDHKEAIDEFEDEAQDGNDPQVKAWAASKVPGLQHHLQEAERIQKVVNENKNQ